MLCCNVLQSVFVAMAMVRRVFFVAVFMILNIDLQNLRRFLIVVYTKPESTGKMLEQFQKVRVSCYTKPEIREESTCKSQPTITVITERTLRKYV